WRYWQALPPAGRVGIFLNGWYAETLAVPLKGVVDNDELHAHLDAIRQHEQMLCDEGSTLVKFWIHLSKAMQKKRLDALDNDPRTSWRVTRADWKRYRLYTQSHDLWEHVLRENSTGDSPWFVIEGSDERYRNLAVVKILLDAMQRMVAAKQASSLKHGVPPTTPSVVDNV